MNIRHLIWVFIFLASINHLMAQPSMDSSFGEVKFPSNILVLSNSSSIQNNNNSIGWDSILTPFNATFATTKNKLALKNTNQFPGIKKQIISKDFVFYFILSLFLFLGILNAVFKNYFNTMIRVFFKTSLRQSQLTDQLMQAKLPSLCLNIFSVLVKHSLVLERKCSIFVVDRTRPPENGNHCHYHHPKPTTQEYLKTTTIDQSRMKR